MWIASSGSYRRNLVSSSMQPVRLTDVVNTPNHLVSVVTHIVDQNLTVVLEFVWTLIEHFSMRLELGTDNPKQCLLSWIRTKLPVSLPVKNFTSDWNNGVALGAMVGHHPKSIIFK